MSLDELHGLIGGRLRLGRLPPLGGGLEPVGRIVTQMAAIASGDVYFEIDPQEKCEVVEQAYFRGAQGIVADGRRIEPWAGRFAIEVENAAKAFWLLACHREDRSRAA